MAGESESIRQFPEAPAEAGLARYAEWGRMALRIALIVAVCMLALASISLVFGRLPAWAWGLLVGTAAALLTLRYGQPPPPETPAMDEARLMALTARIRPHFLYNSLNAVLGTIRSDPRRAETALEEMAELFRALMHDPRELVPLSDEIALCRKYLALERLRLGDERVQVKWDIESCPPDALMPPLMLQPLLENAVYHGIEPMDEPGPITISMRTTGAMLVIELGNPHETRHSHAKGNRMALTNIRERLALFFGDAAYLNAEMKEGSYEVRIVLPYQRVPQRRNGRGGTV
jgi:two-component system sensor histidine kinase AlgZ